MTDSTAVVAATCEAYRAAVLAKDVDAFVALYADAVRVFDLWDDWSHDGVDGWRDTVDGWFGSLGADRVDVAFESIVATGGDPLIVGHAFVAYTNVGADGRPQRAMRNRITWVLRRDDAMPEGAWKIVHEHTSAPVDGATFKVRFEP